MLLVISCVLLLVPSLYSMPFSGIRDRRSDDVSTGALQVIVQEQSALIQSLQAKVAALETTVSDLKTRVSQEDDRLGRVQHAGMLISELLIPNRLKSKG